MADRIIEKHNESPAAGYFFGIMIVGAIILLVVWFEFTNRNTPPPAAVPVPTVPQSDSLSSEGGQEGEGGNVDIDFPDQIDINMNDGQPTGGQSEQ